MVSSLLSACAIDLLQRCRHCIAKSFAFWFNLSQHPFILVRNLLKNREILLPFENRWCDGGRYHAHCRPKNRTLQPQCHSLSVGCLFSVPIAMASRVRSFSFKWKRHPVYSAALKENAQAYTGFDYTKATAIAVGTENSGLSEAWMAEESTPIPMLGKNDSLNVSVAAGILLAEVQRQRI